MYFAMGLGLIEISCYLSFVKYLIAGFSLFFGTLSILIAISIYMLFFLE